MKWQNRLERFSKNMIAVSTGGLIPLVLLNRPQEDINNMVLIILLLMSFYLYIKN